jgi:hypothetical protein
MGLFLISIMFESDGDFLSLQPDPDLLFLCGYAIGINHPDRGNGDESSNSWK